ncbi:MFS transporter [Legionella jordanis]|uniref:Major facilitator superfamily transporter n=1 Tax=Legionella jordanis TaxID=456 RepID=A0A0W0VBG5_9GAMM|nr:MFS transporter [Legionella jordanis]KTD16985.1 major facilitator superfamily transporter [Legionella jordanis]VEH12821.1 major facilitator superfamily transporter [Legionella jordanis]
MKPIKYFSGISKNTILLALASFFSDVATEMLYPILPVFLMQTLQANGIIVGLIEGIAQAGQNIIQGFSGWLSDKMQQKKRIALIGYFLGALAKPLLGLAGIWQMALGARTLDRLASGFRSAPRDALVAASVTREHRGKAFGLEGFGDNLGAFMGPLVTLILLACFWKVRSIFYLAVLPGLLAFFMVLAVKEKSIDESGQEPKIQLTKFPKAYWKYLAVIALFGIGNSSNAFLILKAQDTGLSLEKTVLIYAGYNLLAALVSYPAGFLSDKFGRKYLLLSAFLIFFICYLGFALSDNFSFIAFLFILYGCYQGIFRSVGKALALDFVPGNLHASAVGWFSTTVGIQGLFASLIAGILWDYLSHSAVFFYGALFAFLGSVALLILVSADSHARRS